MLFNSLQFLVFFPIVTAVYFLIPDRIKYLWLLAASYFFYMCWNAKYALLLLFSTVVTYAGGLALGRLRINAADQALGNPEHGEHGAETVHDRNRSRMKLILFVTCAANLGILFYFKYFNFAFQNLNSISERLLHLHLNAPAYDVVLPVGISFYTFQALGYAIDVYRGDILPEKNFFRYALFVSFFPQLVAGPIERSGNLLEQLKTPRKFDYEATRDGLFIMLWGYFLKIVIADRAAVMVDTIYGNPEQYPGWYLITATVLFAFQIYCDFAGYSVIAMGAARILGISLMENFNAPYLAQSCGEFWRRWHISLSTWFRDYVYIPLGGNRKGIRRKYINILIVFLLSGLWHGASWAFVVWGLLHGLYQVIGQLLKPLRDRIVHMLRIDRNSAAHKLLRVLVTFALVDFAWIFFRVGDFSESFVVIRSIFHAANPWILVDHSLYSCGLDEENVRLLLLSLGLLLFADLCHYRGICIRDILQRQHVIFRALFLSACACGILIFGMWGSGYNAANFIYFQF